jgi:hypothetical protein
VTPEAAFVKAWGRQPTPLEVERLRRLREAFSIDENDALLTIAMVLEFYDGVFRLYPAKCGEATRNAVELWLRSSEGRAALLNAVRPTAAARPLALPRAEGGDAEARRELFWVVVGCIGMATSAFSTALGMRVSAALSGSYPCWVPTDAASSLAVNLLGAPMGWLVAWAMLVPCAWGTIWGWRRGRNSALSVWQRAAGWSLVTAIGIAGVAWCFLLWQLPGARR